MSEVKHILKSQILIIKNLFKICLVKYTLQLIIFISLFCIMLYFGYSSVKNIFSGASLGENANMLIFLKTIYNSIGILLVIVSFMIMLFSYKYTIGYWTKLKCIPIKIDKLFIVSMLLYLLIIGSIFGFIIISVAYVMRVNTILTLLFIAFFYTLIIGNLLMTYSIYKIVNIKFQNKLAFYISTFTTLGLIYCINSIIFNLKTFEQVNIFDYIFILMPLIVGILLYACLNKYSIRFPLVRESSRELMIIGKSFKNFRYPYLDILIAEFFRNINFYLEFMIAPYFIFIVFKFLNYNNDYSTLTPLLSMISSVPIGLYYSYNNSYKLIPISAKWNLLSRGVFSLILVSINYAVFMVFDANFISTRWYAECILLSIFLILILNIVKLPILEDNKDNVMFYITACLIPSLYKLISFVFVGIVDSYFQIVIDSNLILVIFNLMLIIYTFVLMGRNKSGIL